MLISFIPEALAPYLALGVLAVMFLGFVSETYPTEVIALGGAAFVILTGLLPYEAAEQVFANPAPWTIAAMFVLSAALARGAVFAHKRA